MESNVGGHGRRTINFERLRDPYVGILSFSDAAKRVICRPANDRRGTSSHKQPLARIFTTERTVIQI